MKSPERPTERKRDRVNRRITSSFREDTFSSDELDEAIEYGEVGYCEVAMHYDWSDNIQGYTRLEDPTNTLSICEDCERDALRTLVAEAITAKLDHAEALRRVEALVQRGHYDAETGARLAEALEAHRLQQVPR